MPNVFLRFIAFFLGLVLAIIHVVVGLMTYFIYDTTLGTLFLLASAGYAAGAFLMIFNMQKGGLVLIALFHFLDFGMMLYYREFMLLFPCLIAEAAAFFIILDVWKGYATESEEPLPEVNIVKKKKVDSLGFDSNYYFDKYYNKLEGKGGVKAKRPRVKPKQPRARSKAKEKIKRPAPKQRN